MKSVYIIYCVCERVNNLDVSFAFRIQANKIQNQGMNLH